MSIWNITSFVMPSFPALSTIETVAVQSAFPNFVAGISAYQRYSLLGSSSATLNDFSVQVPSTFSYTVATTSSELTFIVMFFTPD